MRQVAVALLVACALGATPSIARADDDADITEMAKEHYKLGLEAYKTGHYPEAIKELKKAYLLKRLPALLLNIGATYRKMGDSDNAVYYYKKYLAEAPDAKDRGEAEQAIAEIQSKNPNAGANASDAVAAAPGKGWSHTPVDAAPPGAPLDVRVTMPVTKGIKVYVYYRGAGESDFTSVLMKRRGTDKVGRIPAEALAGKSLQYYIEGKDENGSVVKSFGSPSNPNVVMVDASAAPQTLGEDKVASDDGPAGGARKDLDDEEAPMTGAVDEPRSARAHNAHGGKKSDGSRHFGAAFWTGTALEAVGVAGVIVGAVGLNQAKSYSNVLTADSQGDSNGAPFQFNDPNANPYDDRTVQYRGRTWNTIGEAGMGVGIGCLVVGAVLQIVDQTVLNKPSAEKSPAGKPKHHRSEDAWNIGPGVGNTTQTANIAGGAIHF